MFVLYQSAEMDSALLTEQSRKVGEVVKSARKNLPSKLFDKEIPLSSYMKKFQQKRNRKKEIINSLGLGQSKGMLTRLRCGSATSGKKTSGGTPKKLPKKKSPSSEKEVTSN